MVFPIFHRILNGFRIRSYHRHIPPQNIKKLGQFIQMRCYKQMPAIKFILRKMLAILSQTLPFYQNRISSYHFNIKSNQQIQPGQQHHHKHRKADIKNTLCHSLFHSKPAVTKQLQSHIRQGNFLGTHQHNIRQACLTIAPLLIFITKTDIKLTVFR